jgi:RNA polymerase sigma-70 factor (ECF subfamily)
MVGVMAKIATRTDNDDLVQRARTDAEALGRLYDKYYDRILRFCLCRVFSREAAEDITSVVFLTVARGIGGFKGRTQADFRNWLYRISVNQANSYIRKTSRRNRLFEKAARMMQIRRTDSADHPGGLDWPTLYAAILKLKPKHQTIITLRFFENLEFEQIAEIVKARPSTVRVTLHRILRKLRNHLQTVVDGEGQNV